MAGISFGNSLIKQVASDLSRDLPALKNFVTLSPIPGLNKWFETTNINAEPSENEQAFAAHYLLEAKRSDGMPTDPVARFHLGNGAMVHAVHANADISDNGMAQSNGTMVNYLYELRDVSQNHERFVKENTIAVSGPVKALSASVKTAIPEKKSTKKPQTLGT